jgi:hypothetical protein
MVTDMRKPGVNAEHRIVATLQELHHADWGTLLSHTKLSKAALSSGLERLYRQQKIFTRPVWDYEDPRGRIKTEWSLMRRSFLPLDEQSSPQGNGTRQGNDSWPTQSAIRVELGISSLLEYALQLRDRLLEERYGYLPPPALTLADTERTLVTQLAQDIEKLDQQHKVPHEAFRQGIRDLLKRGAFKTRRVLFLVPSRDIAAKMKRLEAEAQAIRSA